MLIEPQSRNAFCHVWACAKGGGPIVQLKTR